MVRNDEREQLLLRLRQGAERADKLGCACPGRFIAAEERGLAMHEAWQHGISVSFDGGWPEAERVQVCFHPAEEEPVFTALWMEACWNGKFAQADHRSLLGSLMALGMDRAFFGDIVIQEDHAYLCVLPEVALRLPMEWTQAGRVSLKVRPLEQPPPLKAPKGLQLRDTVASLRLDSILAGGMKTSRSRAAEIIREGQVLVEHQPEERMDRVLSPGQLISVRGFGRIRLLEVGQPTRKNRLPVTLEIFSRS